MPIDTVFKTATPESLNRRIDEYFDIVKKKKLNASLTGLALHLGCTRKMLTEYKATDHFGPVLERAKLRCENVLEEKMINGTPPTGIIFILKNNYGWHDKIESDINLSGSISLAKLFDQATQKKLDENKEPVEGEIINESAEVESLPDEIF